MKDDFWAFLEQLITENKIKLDRPKGSHHPRYPQVVYPLDYGFLENTSSPDGAGMDIWLGGSVSRQLTGIIITVDLIKQDSEIKLLLGCSDEEIQTVFNFHNQNSMRALLVKRFTEVK